MSLESLRANCVRETCRLLVSGVWDECEENPFSSMPTCVVQDILSCMWPAGSALSRARVAPSSLLLTSGRLEHVVLPQGGKGRYYVRLLRMLSRGCQHLQTLSAFCLWTVKAEIAFQGLLPNCAKLEHLHSNMYFHPDALRNCRNLKTLRLHFGEKEIDFFCRRITSELLKRLRSVEVFSFCHLIEVEKYVNTRFLGTAAVSILDNCPKLTSMGFFDSSAALQQLYNRDLKNLRTPRQFQLRRCYWDVGKRSWQTPWFLPGLDDEYCERTRVAALSCPHTETLVIEVIDAGSLQYLKTLKNLTCLYIKFTVYYDEVEMPELHRLLEKIGPQLRHLSIHSHSGSRNQLNLNVVSQNCPNLSTLELECSATVDEDIQPCANLMSLERLSVDMYRQVSRNGLIFLLSSCPKLKVLLLGAEKEFDNGAMRAILRKNPFSELEVASIDGCSLSESGLRRFVQSAVNLTNLYFRSFSLKEDDVVRCVRDANSSAVCYLNLTEDPFPQGLRESCWL